MANRFVLLDGRKMALIVRAAAMARIDQELRQLDSIYCRPAPST